MNRFLIDSIPYFILDNLFDFWYTNNQREERFEMTDAKNQTTNTTVKKSGRGGARPGAGRPKMKDDLGRPVGTNKKKHSIYCNLGELAQVREFLQLHRDLMDDSYKEKYSPKQQEILLKVVGLMLDFRNENKDTNNQ